MVGVYATSTSTPLFFAQAVGRFVRARRRGETASIFLPSVPLLLRLAGELEEERDHVLGRVSTGDWTEEDALVAQALQERDTADLLVEDQLSFEALESEATFDRILFDGGEFGTAPATVEEEEFLGIPGLLDADQVSDLLRSRGTGPTPNAAAVVVTVDVPALKRELNDCVRAYARQSGTSQAQVHSELRRASGGPEVARASAAELRTRIERIRAWAVGRR
jgi:superfamily II DNA or RNA helicase